MMNQVYKTLPDDRPITSICVVEDLDKCPKGFIPVSRTHDQDADADLWRESGFFGRKCTRYLCLSKTEGVAEYVVQAIVIMNEKDPAPKGYTAASLTVDSGQKAWRKRQLCFKLAHKSTTSTAVTDIIILSRMKKAPEEFSLSGEINGMTVCYKVGKSVVENGLSNANSQVPYCLYPSNPGATSPNSLNSGTYQNIYPGGPTSFTSQNGVQGAVIPKDPLVPRRPAPKPPTTYATISGYGGLEGVPFILNPKWNFTNENFEVIGVIIIMSMRHSCVTEPFPILFRQICRSRKLGRK
ncbi:UNVERIFIED_CONTAM: hypothetical protein PYX00_003900 [Menopon gallinae]|uniref:MABP domain-containing protein n=1 Tax=Menopon gallinae TaxID=328185 RepID=A0AAW2I2R6_9NEOP